MASQLLERADLQGKDWKAVNTTPPIASLPCHLHVEEESQLSKGCPRAGSWLKLGVTTIWYRIHNKHNLGTCRLYALRIHSLSVVAP